MELLALVFDFLLHFDKYLTTFVESHGAWVYALIFLIVFAETGLMVDPRAEYAIARVNGQALIVAVARLAAIAERMGTSAEELGRVHGRRQHVSVAHSRRQHCHRRRYGGSRSRQTRFAR